MPGLKSLCQRTDLVDVCSSDNIIHIKVDSDKVLPDEKFKTSMLEQLVYNTYTGAEVTTNHNKYGLLTDIWIKFQSPTDAIHFKLSSNFNMDQ